MNRILAVILVLLSTLFFAQANAQKVVYSSTNNPSQLLQIFTMNIDGTDKKQLTDLSSNCMFPKFSPDGNSVVFQTDLLDMYYIADINAATVSYPMFVFKGFNPIFTANGEYIIFSGEHEGMTTLYMMAPTDADAYLISMDDYSTMATLAADGRTLVYSAFGGGHKNIYITDLEDSTSMNGVKISSNKDANLEPDISSDGKMITYASFDMNLKGTIYLYKDGSEVALTKGMSSANQPQFSPDASKIAFTVVTGDDVDLYLMNNDGSNVKQINVNGGDVGRFEWVDNNLIIFDANYNDQSQIGVVNINTGKIDMIADVGLNAYPNVLR
jgi:Tol biopolymer transport system component